MSGRWYKTVQVELLARVRNHVLLNISPDDFLDTEFSNCRLHEGEQARIGRLFASLDNLITLHQRKHDQLATS